MVVEDFDTLVETDDLGIVTSVEGLGVVLSGLGDSAFVTEIARFVRGEPGTAGAPGGAVFVWNQPVASAEWDIEHNLGRVPPIQVVDSTGRQVEGEETFPDLNHVRLNFTFPFAGKAYLG